VVSASLETNTWPADANWSPLDGRIATDVVAAGSSPEHIRPTITLSLEGTPLGLARVVMSRTSVCVEVARRHR
jgi:hypothetical protein